MINKKIVTEIVQNKIQGSDIFLVDITVSKSFKIDVYVDSPNGVNIKQCVDISRAIESSFDREEHDFELQVSTPGLDSPFKVEEQYLKNIGREVEIKLIDEQKIKGILLRVEPDFIEIEVSKKVKVEGKKKKQNLTEKSIIEKKNIIETKVIISF